MGHTIGDAAPAQTLVHATLEQMKPDILASGWSSAEEFQDITGWVARNEVLDVAMIAISVRRRRGPDV